MVYLVENSKYFLLNTLLFLCVLPCITEAATFTSRNSGDWTNPCTWSNSPSCAGLLPVEGLTIPGILDDVVISGRDVVTATSNVYINSLTLNNGTGAEKTTINIFGDIDFIISGNLRMESQTLMQVDGGAFINVKGDVCVKNDGNIIAQGIGPDIGGTFLVDGCATVGSTNCVPGGSGTPNFISSTYLIFCIACAANSANLYEGTAGACYSAMPVELLSFKAEFSKNSFNEQVLLSWVTIREDNNHLFTIERSEDGINFSGILYTESKTDASKPASYQATDLDPLPGFSYYRLKQTDKDGKFTYSKTLVLKAPQHHQIRFSPNPLNGNALNIEHAFESSFSIYITDMLGRVVDPQSFTMENNPSYAALHFHQALAPGMYTIQFINKNNSVTKKLCVR